MFVKRPGHSKLSSSSAAALRSSLAYFLMNWVPVLMYIYRKAKPDLSAARFFLPSVNDVEKICTNWKPTLLDPLPADSGPSPWGSSPGPPDQRAVESSAVPPVHAVKVSKYDKPWQSKWIK